MRLLRILAILAVVWAPNCGQGDESGEAAGTIPTTEPTLPSAESDGDPFAASHWELTHLVAPDGTTMPAAVDSPLSFSDGRFTAIGACNEMGGTYEVGDDGISMAAQSLTDRPCAGRAGDQETHVFAVLEGTSTWELEDETLTLTAPDQRGLRYRRT